MKEDVSSALTYALSRGFQIHPDAFKILEKIDVKELEKIIDKFLGELEPLKEFILPSGRGGGPYLHLARAVSRRAERRVVKLMEEAEVNENVLAYINRLSDLLFVMARIENKRVGFEETYVRFNK